MRKPVLHLKLGTGKSNLRFLPRWFFLLLMVALVANGGKALADEFNLFARTNLVAWRIVPFDTK